MIQTTQKKHQIALQGPVYRWRENDETWNWSNTFNQQKEIFEGQLLLKQTMFERDADFIS